MATSRVTSNGPDWKDAAEALRAFERQNQARVVTTLRSAGTEDVADIWLEAKALGERTELGVRPLLAFASVTCSSTNRTTLDAALLALLYALDFQLAENAWVENLKADNPLPPH